MGKLKKKKGVCKVFVILLIVAIIVLVSGLFMFITIPYLGIIWCLFSFGIFVVAKEEREAWKENKKLED